MNKQQLANKIWESANKMRSKIEANEYNEFYLDIKEEKMGHELHCDCGCHK